MNYTSAGIYVHFYIIDPNKECIYGHDNGQKFSLRFVKQSHVIASHDLQLFIVFKKAIKFKKTTK